MEGLKEESRGFLNWPSGMWRRHFPRGRTQEEPWGWREEMVRSILDMFTVAVESESPIAHGRSEEGWPGRGTEQEEFLREENV